MRANHASAVQAGSAGHQHEGMIGMAGLLERVQTILGAKANRALDAVENPAETIDYSYAKMQDALQETRRHLVEVATAKQTLLQQQRRLEEKAAAYDRDARDAVAQGRDDLATQALALKATVSQDLESLKAHVAETEAAEAKLHQQQQDLEARVEAFGTQKEVLKAEYSAAKAHVAIGEAVGGISHHAEDLSSTLDRAQDKIQALEARGRALDEIQAQGTAAGGDEDSIHRELAAAHQSDAVQAELARLKAEAKGS